MSSFPHKLWKWTAGTFAVLVILLGLCVGVFRIALEQIPDYRTQIQAWVSERSGLHITFSDIDARWRFYGPELVFSNAVVGTPDGNRTLIEARRGSIAFDIWASLASRRLTTGRFWLDAPQLVLVRTREGRIQLVGQDELPERTEPFSFDGLPTGQFNVSNAHVTFIDLATNRGPWEFARVDLALQRGAAAMHLEGTAELPSAVGRQLEFAAHSEGRLDVPAELNWNFALEGTDLDLAGLKDVLPDTWSAPAAGVGTFRVAGVLQGSHIEELSGTLDLTSVVLPLPVWSTPLPVPDPLVIRAVAISEEADTPPADVVVPRQPALPDRMAFDVVRADFDMRRDAQSGWRLVVDGLQLKRSGDRWEPSRLELDVRTAESGHLAVAGRAQFLSLDSIWPLLAYLPEREDTAHLRALRASGRLSDLSFEFARKTEGVTPTYMVSGKFDDVGVAPVGRTPGVDGLTGTLTASDRDGRFILTASDFTFSLPRMFREPLVTDHLAGTLTWRRTEDGWRIGSERIVVDGVDGNATASFELVLPEDGSSPVLALQASGSDLDATATSRYLPAGRLTQRTLAWLDRAFPAGKVSTADIEYHGPVRNFPFRGGEGTFVARGDLAGATLDYDPNWLPLTEINGTVEFRNQGLTVQASAGRVHGMQLSAGRVHIADLRTAELDIDARVQGDLGAALDYLKRSSVGPALGEQFLALEGNGAADIEAHIWLPIRALRDRRVDVTTHLTDAQVGRRGITERLTNLNGSLQVLDRTLASSGLQGQFLGGPVNIVLHAQESPGAPPATALSASGRALAVPLAQFLSVPDVVELSGVASWRMQARFVANGNAGQPGNSTPGVETTPMPMTQSYVIESDLEGLGIGLPAPVGKTPPQRQPFRAEIEFDGSPSLLVRGSLGALRTVVRLNHRNGVWELDRAGLRADGIAASVPGHPGLRIEGDIPELLLDDWLALRRDGPHPSGRLSDILKAANVRVGTLGLLGYTWKDVRGLLQATDTGWQIDLAGPDATGKLHVPYELTGHQPLSMTMEQLTLSARSTERGHQSHADPRQVPAVHAHINDLKLGERQLGNIRLQMDRVPGGLEIANLTAQADSFSAEVKGTWMARDGSTAAAAVTTTLDATLSSTEVRATLRALGYNDFITGDRGLLQAKLSWAGGPDMQALGRASGTVHLEINDGQMLDLQPGAGRMLGLLSVAALPRRLSLDFSDLTDEGLAFDSIRGDFELKEGNAYTSNLLLSGPAAEIGIAGRTGIGTRDYDQTAVVTGNFGATLPVAGVIAGGPVVGAAMLLFSQVFKESLKGITRGYYRITGNWDEPQVERMETSNGKETAAQVPSASSSTPPTPGPSTSP